MSDSKNCDGFMLFIRKVEDTFETDVGFIHINKKVKLSSVRDKISEEFDETQKGLLTDSFKFLNRNFIVSKSQESQLIPFDFLKSQVCTEGDPIRILEIRSSKFSHIPTRSTDSSISNMIYNDKLYKTAENSSIYLDPLLTPKITIQPVVRMNDAGQISGDIEPDVSNSVYHPLVELPPTVESKNPSRKALELRTSSLSKVSFSGITSQLKSKNRSRALILGHHTGPRTIKMSDLLNLDVQKSNIPLWIDIQAPSLNDLNELGKKFKIHPLTIEDISMRDSREKLEIFKNYLLVIFYSEHFILEEDATENPICLLLYSNFVISFHKDNESCIDSLIKKISKLRNQSIHSPSYICYSVLDKVVDDLIPVSDSVLGDLKKVEEIGRKFAVKDQNEFLDVVSKTRNNITLLRQRLWPKQNMLNNMLHKTWRRFLSDVSVAYFRDCQEHIAKMLNMLEIQNENLNNIQNLFLAKVSLEVAESSHQMDQVAKKFASIATITLPLTMITGIFGMNVTVPFQTGKPEVDPYGIAFYTILAFFCIFSILCFILMRRKKFI